MVAALAMSWKDIQGMHRFEKAMAALGSVEMRAVGNRAVNRTGDMARTQVRRELPKQTGLKRGTIVRAVRVSRSTPQTLTYEMTARGGDVSLKYFDARETRRGVSARPFGLRKVFPGTFMKAGWWPHRVAKPGWNGQVFKRAGLGKFPIEKQKSGVIIPAEMVKGATAKAFSVTVARVLPKRVAHEIKRLTKGVAS